MPTTVPPRTQPYHYQRRSWRKPVIILVIIAALLAGAVWGVHTIYERIRLASIVPGCQAGTGASAIALDFGQAQNAATIADVAVYDHLPARALAIAYATALQESKLANLDYGTSDSVGLFQQRPSQRWGSVQELENPVFASQDFFENGPSALTKIPGGYESMAIAQAAQDVQRSADGEAYAQWADEATDLASDYMTTPHAVTCWYDPATQAKQIGASTQLNLRGASRKLLNDMLGSARPDGIVTSAALAGDGKSETYRVAAPGDGWAVANWLVTNAASFGITNVAYDGYQWTAALTETSWQPAPGGQGGSSESIVAS